MRMLILLTLLTLSSCGVNPKLPEFPDIKDHYLVEVRNEPVPQELKLAVENPEDIVDMSEQEVARCLQFEIIEKIPYKIRFVKQVPMKECHLVGGYKPKDSISIYNWLIDAKEAVEKYKKCFK